LADSTLKQSYRIFIIALYVGVLSNIQSVIGGKVGILGSHNIGDSNQKYYVYMYPIPNGFRDRGLSLYNSKIVDKKKILRTVSNTGIYEGVHKKTTSYGIEKMYILYIFPL
jgi:hypothetical protein